MRTLTQLLAVAAASTLVLSGCGGGGGGTSPHPVTPATTPASTTSSHTAVGTARLTLALPKVVTAKGGKSVVRAIPHGAARARANGVARRMPKYINPSPNPGFGPCPGGENILDIYVNGVLLPAIDALGESPDSLCVAQTTDSTQTVTIPLYSTTSSQIVVVEWDATFGYVLAIGETDYGSFSPGGSPSLTLTMQMNAYYTAIIDLGFSTPQLMNDTTYTLNASCPGTAQFALFTADATGTLVPVAGYGGTSTPSLVGSPVSGTTSLAQSSIPGIYNVAYDSNCDELYISATAQNPAYAILNDVYNYLGQYPGIAHLYYSNASGGNGQYFQNWFDYQLDYNPVTGDEYLYSTPP